MAREQVIITVGGRIQDAVNKLNQVGKSIGNLAGKWAAMAGVVSIAASAFMLFKSAITEAMDMEQSLASLATLTGDIEVAKQKMSELVRFAQNSPLDLKGVQDTARLLLATGTSADDLMSRIEMLGDIAAGAKQPINELGLVFSQVMNKGKLMAEDLNQFSERGVPLLQELAAIYKVSAAEIMKMGEAGKISSEMVLYALNRMTSEGGRFYQAMADQNRTFTGMLSSMKETWLERLRDFGTPIVDALKPILGQITSFLTGSKQIFVTMGETVAGWVTAANGALKKLGDNMPMIVWNVKIFVMEFARAGTQMIMDVIAAVKGLTSGVLAFVGYIRVAMEIMLNVATQWETIWDNIMSGKGKDALASVLGDFVAGMAKVNEDIASNPLIKALDAFNTGLESNAKLLGDAITTLMGTSPAGPMALGGSSMKGGGKDAGAPPESVEQRGFSAKDAAELEAMAKGLGQASGTAASARTALARMQRAEQQRLRGNIEEAERAERLARYSQRLARRSQDNRTADKRAEDDRRGAGGFRDKGADEIDKSQIDPRTGRLRTKPQLGPEPPNAAPKSEEVGWLTKTYKLLNERLPEEVLT